MSTRSNIIIVTPENQAHQFYHHCDGYLSGVGEELRGFLNTAENYEDLLKKLDTPDEYGGYYRDEGKFDQKLAANGLHADIEFLYVIKNNKLYYMEIWKSKDFEELRTYKELIDYICISKHEIDLTKEVTDDRYIYEDNKPEDYTPKTEAKTKNYAEEKTRIENEIKRLQSELETLEKQRLKEGWKKSLVEKFKEFLERTDFAKVEHVEFYAKKSGSNVPEACEVWFYNPKKVETEPKAEPKAEEKTEPTEKPAKAEPKPEPEPKPEQPKPQKMKMSLDEFIQGLK